MAMVAEIEMVPRTGVEGHEQHPHRRRAFGTAPGTFGPELTAGGRAVTLRGLHVSDGPARIRLRQRNRVQLAACEPDGPVVNWAARHAYYMMRSVAGSLVILAIEVDGEYVGEVSVGLDASLDDTATTAWLGVWVDQVRTAHGVGTLAAAMVADYCFTYRDVVRMEAPILPSNTASRRGVERLGFVQETMLREYLTIGAVARDHLLYALLATAVPAGGLVAMLREQQRQQQHKQHKHVAQPGEPGEHDQCLDQSGLTRPHPRSPRCSSLPGSSSEHQGEQPPQVVVHELLAQAEQRWLAAGRAPDLEELIALVDAAWLAGAAGIPL